MTHNGTKTTLMRCLLRTALLESPAIRALHGRTSKVDLEQFGDCQTRRNAGTVSYIHCTTILQYSYNSMSHYAIKISYYWMSTVTVHVHTRKCISDQEECHLRVEESCESYE